MKFHKYICNLLFILIIIYFAQGPLYAQGSGISQVVLFFILSVSFLYFAITFLDKNNKNLYYKAFTSLLLLNTLGFLLTGNISDSIHFGQLKAILFVALPFYPIYFFTQKNIIKVKHLIFIFILALPIAILNYIHSENRILAERLNDNINIVNNASYAFVFLIPYAFLFKKRKIIGIVSALLLMLFIVQGSKRGAIVTGVVGLLWYMYYQLKIIDKKKKVRGYLMATLSSLLLGAYGYKYYLSNEFLIKRMTDMAEGQASGRDIIYLNLFNAWYHSDSYIYLLFGRGFAKTVEVSGSGHLAHNDWLELLTNFGLLGIIIYLSIFYAGYKYIKDTTLQLDRRLMLATIMSIWFLTTLFSMNYTSYSPVYQNIMVAYLIANYNVRNNKS